MSIDLEHFSRKLAEMERDIRVLESGDRERGRPVELDQTRIGRLSRMDAIQDQAMSEAVHRRRELALRRIEAALERLRTGEFGYCISCGDPIDVARLEIDPAAPCCADCAANR